MKKPYWFPLDVNKFLSSTKVAVMTTEEIGAYTLLLCHEWNDPSCTLPNDDDALRKMGRIMGDLVHLRACFTSYRGRLINPVLHEIWQDTMKRQQVRSSAGVKGNAIRWGSPSDTDATRKAVTNDRHSQSQSHIQIQREKKKRRVPVADATVDASEGFEKVWGCYPWKAGKQEAEKAWKKSSATRPTLDIILAAIEKEKRSLKWTKDNGEYIPRLSTWINQARWNDETVATLLTPAVTPTTLPKSYRKLESVPVACIDMPEELRARLATGIIKDIPH